MRAIARCAVRSMLSKWALFAALTAWLAPGRAAEALRRGLNPNAVLYALDAETGKELVTIVQRITHRR